MQNKLLTLSIAAYNMEAYLEKCIDSLLVPSLNKVEIIIVNDASTDRTSEIAHRYESKFPESIIVIDNEKNGHYGKTVNCALQVASGKYIKLLDADDYMCSEIFEEYVQFLSNIDVDLVLSNCKKINEDGKVIGGYTISGYEHGNVYDVTNCNLLLQPHQNVAYKTENLRRIGLRLTEGIAYTDSEWLHMPMTTVKTFSFFDRYLYMYLIGREGQTVNPSNMARQLDHQMKCVKSMIDSWEAYQDNDLYKDFLYRHIIGYLESLYKMCIVSRRLCDDAMFSFDNQIKEKSVYIYDQLATIYLNKRLKFPYILYWRRNGGGGLPYGIKLQYKLLNKAMRFVGKVKAHRMATYLVASRNL